MNISSEQLAGLLALVGTTADAEIDCEEFLSLLPGHLERCREHGRAHRTALPSLDQHLLICPECQEEVDGLMDALDEGLL